MASLVPSSATGAPRILASANLPPVISFSSAEEPQLLISLTPLDFDSPITFALSHTDFFPLENCLLFRNSKTLAPQYLPVVHTNWGHSRQLELCREREAEFVTIRPHEPYVFTVNFRPFGNEIPSDELRKNMPMEEQFRRAMNIGMHTLEIGETYEIGVKEGLRIPLWLPEDKAHLIPASGQEPVEPVVWKPSGPPIEITSASPTRFLVEP